MNVRHIIEKYKNLNYILLDTCIEDTQCIYKLVKKGKIRDIYENKDLIIITSDRLSSFNRVFTTIPLKGIILNKISTWWFNKTKHLVPNHIIDSYGRTMIVKKTKVFPIEFVMRGYLTGTTNTSIWNHYKAGVRYYCGHRLKNNMVKNQKLDNNILTPTTKGDVDLLTSEANIIKNKIMTQAQFNTCKNYAHMLFEYGQEVALQKGLILVDTKYEFGLDSNNNIILIDELHTPDSSRYWLSDTYEEKINNELEPETIDKDFIRKWINSNYNNPYSDNIIITDNMRLKTSNMYLMLHDIITN